MHTIENHIDYLFQALPETDEIKRIKNDLYLNAIDRYDELMASGKTESEALGTIIIEMGDLDDLLEGLGYNQDQDLRDYSTNTLSEAQVLIEAYNHESNKISLGIFVILLASGLIVTLQTFGLAVVGVIILLLFVALAVGLFIHSGLKLEAIEKSLNDDENIFYLTDEDYRIVKEHYTNFQESNRYRVPLGVILTIASAIPLLLLSFYGTQLQIARYGVLLLLIMIGLGVFQFVKYGMVNTAYEKVLNLGEYSVEELRFQKKLEPVAGIYWLLVTIVYLGWSFVTMAWHSTWVVWPIAGVSWGLLVLILKLIFDRDRKYH